MKTKMTVFALRFLIPGIFFVLVGLMTAFQEAFWTFGWRFIAGGALAIGIGVYLLRKTHATPETDNAESTFAEQ